MKNKTVTVKLDSDKIIDKLKNTNVYIQNLIAEHGQLRLRGCALEAALRCRIQNRKCDECGEYIQDGFEHAETCRHYETEKDVTQ